MGPSPPCVGPKANGLKQATRIDRNRKARTTVIARRGTKAGLGTDETVSRPRPMMHSLLAVTSACAASCATNQRIAPGRARTCNTATCAAYRPASAMECYRYTTGAKPGQWSRLRRRIHTKKSGLPRPGQPLARLIQYQFYLESRTMSIAMDSRSSRAYVVCQLPHGSQRAACQSTHPFTCQRSSPAVTDAPSGSRHVRSIAGSGVEPDDGDLMRVPSHPCSIPAEIRAGRIRGRGSETCEPAQRANCHTWAGVMQNGGGVDAWAVEDADPPV